MNSMPEFYRMPRIEIDPETLAARRKRIAPGRRIAILALALVLAIGISELLHPGTVASVLSMLEGFILALWSMICSVADACREFMKYVDSVRS
jgi:hypothetical protein